MNAAAKESRPKKVVQQKKQPEKTLSALKATQDKKTSSESITATVNTNIPAVHSSDTAYSNGSAQVYTQLQESLTTTGDPSNAETQQKEKDYKSTLSIAELRNYNDAKLAATTSQSTQSSTPSGSTSTTAAQLQPVKPVVTENPLTAKTEQQSGEAVKEKAKDTEVKVSGNPSENPGFIALQQQINTTAQSQQHHVPAGKATQEAQAAAESPSNERESMAQASQVTTMDAQEAGLFDRDAFKAELKKKIAAMQLPKNEEQADDFENNNNIDEVNQRAMGDVAQHKNVASGSIATATTAKPDTNAQPVRNVAKMQAPNTGKAPIVTNVNKAMPAKRSAASVEAPLKEQTATIDEQMNENGVTDTMLANSNEPSFMSALDEKNKAKSQSQEATNQFRANEAQQLAQTQNEAQAQATQQVSGMYGARKGKLNQVQADKNQTANKDTEKRKEIADKINSIYKAAKSEVETILDNLDTTVAQKFEAGSKAAKAAFEKHIATNMAAYKKKRYGDSWLSWKNLRRVKDAVVGLPDEVNEFFVSGREVYIKTMESYMDEITDHVTSQLNTAKAKIATGKKDVQTYVESLSPSLRKLGKSAINDIQAKFDALEEDVNSKKDALIDALAEKYAENVAAIDARIEELKAQNQGLVGMVMNAISGIINFIIEVKNTLRNLLSKIAQVIGAIITDPIGFFGMLIEGLTQGFSNFTANIWTHLKTGFFGWLTGAMKGITFTMPDNPFSLKGIFSMSMQLLGMSWQAIRAIGARVIGEPIMKALEEGAIIVQVVKNDGIAGLWDYLKDKFQDLKATVMDTIMDIIQSQVIQAGIKWILGLLSPVGAFVKAAMAIIDVVKFFVQRAAQIMELVNAFIDSVAAIASGKVGAVAKAIENALAKSIPVLIGLLASILGISGLADKVLGVIRKIRKRIEDGIKKFWKKLKQKGKALLRKVGIGKKDKKKKKAKDTRTTAEKKKDLDNGVNEGTNYLKANPTIKKKKIDDKLDDIKATHQLTELKLVVDKHEETGKDLVHVHGKVNPEKEGQKVEVELEAKEGKLAPGSNQKIFGLLFSPNITNRKGTLKGTGSKLAKNLVDDFPMGTRSDYQAHHIIATSSVRDLATIDNSLIMKAAAETGYNINRRQNGVYLPKDYDLAAKVNRPAHTGRHIAKYFNTVRAELNRIQTEAVKAKSKSKPWTEEILIFKVSQAEDFLRSRLMDMKDPMKLQHDDKLKPIDKYPEREIF